MMNKPILRMNMTRLNTHRSTAHLLLTVAGMTGIAALFLPFAGACTNSGSICFEVHVQDHWPLAAPFFLSALVSVVSMRWLISGSISRPERVIAYVASAASAGVTLSLYLGADDWQSGLQKWLAAAVPVATLLLGVYVVRRNLKAGQFKELSPVMAMQVAYLAHCVLVLVAVFGDWVWGAYCALITAVAFSLQIGWILAQPGRRNFDSLDSRHESLRCL